MHYLGIDAGASATQWALINQSGVQISGVEAAMDGHIYRAASKDRMNEVTDRIAQQIRGFTVSGVYLGITGVLTDGSIEQLLKEKFGADATVVSDIELAYRANFSKGQGILLYAGTGSVAYAIDTNSRVHKIGGWGYLLGDEGAGYWIGREAIRQALLTLENQDVISDGVLTQLILNEMDATDWNSIKEFVYSQERSAIAALSRTVDKAANDGDMAAILILKAAAGHLVDLVNRVDGILGESLLPVKFTGGISSSTVITSELGKILGNRVSRSTVDIAVRAAELAR
jgi:N-acetylglucosamine kinase-like BadF-type ATPase